MWRARGTGDAVRIVTLFYSRLYNVTRTRLTASSLPCWFLFCVGPLIVGFLVAALILCLSDLTFRLWSTYLISALTLRLWSARFYSLPPWNRVLAPRIEDTLSKGNFSSVVQVVVTWITFVNICCSDNNCLPSRCLGIATIWSLFVLAGALIKPLLSKCLHLS
jgi:hypothetical protein